MLALLAPAALLCVPVRGGGAQEKEPNRWTVFADAVYASSGRTIQNGVVAVGNGKITLVGIGREETPEKELLKVPAVTAGLIDASVRLDSELK